MIEYGSGNHTTASPSLRWPELDVPQELAAWRLEGKTRAYWNKEEQ